MKGFARDSTQLLLPTETNHKLSFDVSPVGNTAGRIPFSYTNTHNSNIVTDAVHFTWGDTILLGQIGIRDVQYR